MPKWVLLLAEMYANTWIQRIQQETLRSRLTPRRGWKSSSVICHTAKGSLGVSGRRRRRMLMVCSGGIAKRWTSLERDKPSKHQWLQAARARRQHPIDGTHLLCFLDRVAWKSIPPPGAEDDTAGESLAPVLCVPLRLLKPVLSVEPSRAFASRRGGISRWSSRCQSITARAASGNAKTQRAQP